MPPQTAIIFDIETRLDVIRTYAVWLQWARIAGRLTEAMYQAALTASKPFLDMIR